MRLLFAFDEDKSAHLFSDFLKNNRIENTLEANFDLNVKKTVFNIWIHNEDEVNKAKEYLDNFLKNKNIKIEKKIDQVISKKDIEPQVKQTEDIKNLWKLKVTVFFLLTCIILFAINFLESRGLEKKYNLEQPVLLTPLQKQLMFDLPSDRAKLDEVIIKYDLDTMQKLENPPKDALSEIASIENTPSFKGLYDIILEKIQKPYFPIEIGPLFEKIRKGEVYRLFTPCVLHGGLLHILFNMLWLWYLGKQMEPKLKAIRFFSFIIITGIISNIFQYIMGGPYFLGFSGIITAMVGFIFIKEKTAPWEGYNVPTSIFYFIGIFIFAMMFLQLGSFFIQIISPKTAFTPGIANTAHIAGLFTGMVLAKIPFFSWRGR